MISSIYNNPYALWKSGTRQGKTKEQILKEQNIKLKKQKRKDKKDIWKK